MTPKAPVIRAGVLPLKPFSLAQFRNDHAITDENRPLIAAEPRKANLSFNLAIRSTTIPVSGDSLGCLVSRRVDQRAEIGFGRAGAAD